MHRQQQGIRTSKVLSPKKWISSNSFSTNCRQYVLSQPCAIIACYILPYPTEPQVCFTVSKAYLHVCAQSGCMYRDMLPSFHVHMCW